MADLERNVFGHLAHYQFAIKIVNRINKLSRQVISCAAVVVNKANTKCVVLTITVSVQVKWSVGCGR